MTLPEVIALEIQYEWQTNPCFKLVIIIAGCIIGFMVITRILYIIEQYKKEK